MILDVLAFAGALAALVFGAGFLWLFSEFVQGKREASLHVGNVTWVTVVGLVAFVIWGWWSVAVVLLGVGVLWITEALLDR